MNHSAPVTALIRESTVFTKVMTWIVMFLTVYMPTYAAADAFTDAVIDGKDAGATFQQGYATMPTYDGSNTFTLPDGQTLGIEELFQTASGADTSIYSDTYGDDFAAVALGMSEQENLLTEQTPYGDAYRLFLEQAQQGSPPLPVNDPMWAQQENIMSNAEVITGFSGCVETETWDPTLSSVHIPDYQYCTDSSAAQQSCELNHLYEGMFEQISGPEYYEFCGSGCVNVYLGVVADNNLDGGSCRHFVYQQEFNIKDAAFIQQATLTFVQYDDYTRISIDDTPVYIGPEGYPDGATSCELDNTAERYPNLDLTSHFQREGTIRFKQEVAVGDKGEAYARINLRYDPDAVLKTDQWAPPECYIALDEADQCGLDVTCQDLPAGAGAWTPGSNTCINLNGLQICADDFTDPPNNLNPFCRRATVSTDCISTQGQMECYTDALGVEQCFDTTGQAPQTCAALEDDPACVYVDQECVEGAEVDGKCRVWDVRYDCGYDQEITDYSKTTTLDCGQEIRCMGTECVDTNETQSTSFNKVLSSFQVAKAAQNDSNCDGQDYTACQIFKGDALECKVAVGGIQDCCFKPDSSGYMGYLALANEIYNNEQLTGWFNNAMDSSETISTLKGQLDSGWQALSDPIYETWGDVSQSWSETYDAVTSTWTSATDSVSGLSEPVATNIASATPTETTNIISQVTTQIDAFKQQAMGYAYDFLNTAFDGAGDMFFDVATDGIISPAGWLGTLMVIYAYYQIAMLIIELAFPCEEEEYELASRREQKSCTKIGSYCASEILGSCIEKRTSYCCFNSPLSRIVQEQIHLQGIGTWGDAEDPVCSGISLEQMAEVDWQLVDMSEWIAMITEAGLVPTPTDISLGQLTGTGSFNDPSGEGRTPVDQRTIERMQDLDYQQILDYGTRGADMEVPLDSIP